MSMIEKPEPSNEARRIANAWFVNDKFCADDYALQLEAFAASRVDEERESIAREIYCESERVELQAQEEFRLMKSDSAHRGFVMAHELRTIVYNIRKRKAGL